jgi:ribosomal protein S27AE
MLICNRHYLQLYIHGEIQPDKIALRKQRCSICGDTKNMTSHNGIPYCGRHYMQLRLKGETFRTYLDKNDIIIHKNYAEIILRNEQSNEIDKALIDIEDVDKVKDIYWGLTSENYAYNPKYGFLHNLILGIDTSNVLIEVPDHKTRNRLDCRKNNLHIVSRQENSINKGIQSNNTSGYVGVSWSKRANKFRAYIKLNYKQIHLGLYENFEEAVEARRQGELKYFGKIVERKNDIYTVFTKRNKYNIKEKIEK